MLKIPSYLIGRDLKSIKYSSVIEVLKKTIKFGNFEQKIGVHI